jgi:c-di-GMP-binding flagellar brake protein YcgR
MAIQGWIQKDRVVNLSPTPEGETWFVSRISHVLEGGFSIETPSDLNAALHPGEDVRLRVPTPDGLFMLTCSIREIRAGEEGRIVLENPKEVVHMERRAFQRLPIRMETQYAEIRDGGGALAFSHSTALDISGGGLCLETHRSCPQETLLRVKFLIPLGEMEEELILTGRIVRSVPIAGARRSQAGLEFIDITPRQQQSLVQYILDRTKESRPQA